MQNNNSTDVMNDVMNDVVNDVVNNVVNDDDVVNQATPDPANTSASPVASTNNNVKTDVEMLKYVSNFQAQLGQSKYGLVQDVADKCIEYVLQNRDKYPSGKEFGRKVENDILETVNFFIQSENVLREKGCKFRLIDGLPHDIIAKCLLAFDNVVLVNCYENNGKNSEENTENRYNCALGIYASEGLKKGTYVLDEAYIRVTAKKYGKVLNKDYEEIRSELYLNAPIVALNHDKDLIAVNNGIFDYKTKNLMPFSPDFIFTSKSRVNYNPVATNPTFTNPDGTEWNVEDWMKELSDDPAIVDILWKTLGAIVRPDNPWNKVFWLYSTTGNNGKGTFCTLARNLIGQGSHVSIKLQDFSNDFMLEPLMWASVNIVDESDVGEFLDKCAVFKATVTHDPVSINRKFKTPIKVRFHGVHLFCMNELPRIKDRTASFVRRILIVPMEKCFTGKENKLIKEVYLNDQRVLEYVLYKVLNTDYYDLPVPQACADMLEEFKENNNQVYAFWKEMRELFVWDLLPYKFLYDLYKAWYESNNAGTRTCQSLNTFLVDLKAIIEKDPDWNYTKKDNKIRTGSKMNKPEPLISAFDLQDWMNPIYAKSSNVFKNCPLLKEFYRGLFRATSED